MENAQSTESIIDLIDSIDREDILLPEFQRDFVWEIVKTYDLFDSLVRDVFIGAIIYGKPSFEITVREIDKRGRKQYRKRRTSLKTYQISKKHIDTKAHTTNFRIILDGQQRITSIYRAVKGIDEVWLIIKKGEDLRQAFEDSQFKELSLEQLTFEFSGQQSPDHLSIKMADAWGMAKGEVIFEDDKRALFEKTDYAQFLRDDGTGFTTEFRKYLIVAQKLQDPFKSQKLLSYYLIDASSEKFALFFERSNSRGIQLSFVDILSAKLYEGFNLRKAIEQFEDENRPFTLNATIIVRAIAFLVSDGKSISRSYILSDLNYHHFQRYWNDVTGLYKKALTWLHKNHFIISQAWMPYENMLIPLINFGLELQGHDFSQMTEAQARFVRFWYWGSIISNRYSGSTNEVVIQDSNVLRQVARTGRVGDREYFKRLKPQVSSDEDIMLVTKKQSAIYKGVLGLVGYDSRGLKDWKSTTYLDFNDSKLQDHHIFPVKYLQGFLKGDDDFEAIDSVANRTLIPQITNIQIGKKSPSVYLAELKEQNPNLAESLINHKIPLEIMNGDYDELFDVFMEDRARLIFALVKKYVLEPQTEIEDEFLPEVDAARQHQETGLVPIQENFIGTKLSGYRLCGVFTEIPSRHWKDGMMSLLDILHKKHGLDFESRALEIKGNKRFYFSKNSADLRQPALVPSSEDFYVETNLSAQTIAKLCSTLLTQLDYPPDSLSFIPVVPSNQTLF